MRSGHDIVINKAQLFQIVQAVLAKGVIAFVVSSFIFVQPFIRNMERVVRGSKRKIGEKWLVSFATIYVFHHLVGVKL